MFVCWYLRFVPLFSDFGPFCFVAFVLLCFVFFLLFVWSVGMLVGLVVLVRILEAAVEILCLLAFSLFCFGFHLGCFVNF